MSIYVPTVTSGRGLRVSDPLELELQVTMNHLMWLLGTKPGFSVWQYML